MWCRTVLTLVRDAEVRPLYAMGMLEDVSDRKLVEDELTHRAVHDALTGLPNRQLLMDRLGVALARARREPSVGVTVVFIDLDDFKVVNDSFGHPVGDELLTEVARRLSATVRPADTVARYGGDEFVVVAVGDVAGPEEATGLGERLARELKAGFDVSGHQLVCTASLGVAVCTDPHVRPEDLIREADTAMYRAKWAGRDRVELSTRLSAGAMPPSEPATR